ncbi:DUF4139 domain-containing protein [Mesobacillus harenae]|uniref:DUF4139 domain-containing protein n=1 Tax=Mesobacillus harenae TaxID=2213203 RepID=UPI00157FCD7E|nr:DUF4139 domain-containing protein [Mesobacillus harenae]
MYISSKKETVASTVTIYNGGFGLVKERRKVQLSDNDNQIQYLDVAERIETDSIIVNGIQVTELNYDYDLVSKEKLLAKYIDRQVFLKDKQTGEREEYRLLSAENGLVLESSATKEIAVNPEGELILPELPGGLIVKPALVWKVNPEPAEEISVSYLTQGMNWEANYVMELKEETFDLAGWVNISNHSGRSFEEANVKVIAGEVNRIEDIYADHLEDPHPVLYEQSASDFVEKSFADYHIYTLQRATTLKNNQSKQISFLNILNAPVKRYYETGRWSDGLKIMLEFDNRKENGMGLPLPQGKIKVYQEDTDDQSLEFIGEDQISHTPKNEKVKLCLGEAFDLTTTFRHVNTEKEDDYEYEQFRYLISNHKAEPALIKINHYISDRHWEMVSETDKHIREDSQNIIFWVEIQPDEIKKVEFTYRVDKNITLRLKK